MCVARKNVASNVSTGCSDVALLHLCLPPRYNSRDVFSSTPGSLRTSAQPRRGCRSRRDRASRKSSLRRYFEVEHEDRERPCRGNRFSRQRMRSGDGLWFGTHGTGEGQNCGSSQPIGPGRTGPGRRRSARSFYPRQPPCDGCARGGAKTAQNLATDLRDKRGSFLRYQLGRPTWASRRSNRAPAPCSPDLDSDSLRIHARQSQACRHPSESCRTPRRDLSR